MEKPKCENEATTLKCEAEQKQVGSEYVEQMPRDSQSRIIRLVILSATPHPLDGGIQCQLSTFDNSVKSNSTRDSEILDVCPSYEVLSYEAAPTKSKPLRRRIWLNNRLVSVSKNLHLALLSLKDRTSWARVFWIAELCATARNEHDDEEAEEAEMGSQERAAWWRTHQEIVQGARGLVIWLEDTEHIQVSGPESFGTFEIISTMLPPNHFPLQRTTAKTAQIQGVMKCLKGSSPSTKTLAIVNAFWGTMSRLCHRTYWDQISTIRNLCFSRTVHVHFGEEVLLADDLVTFLFQFMKVFEEKVPTRVSDSQFWRLKSYMRSDNDSGPHTTYDFLTLLKLSRKGVCRDRKDKVFGLLSLANDINESNIKVDYSLSIFDLFRRVVGHFLLEEHQTSKTNIVAISQELQLSMLSPDHSSLASNAMTAARQSSQTTERFTLPGVPKGSIAFVSDNPRDLLRIVRVMERAQRSSLANMYHSTFRSDFRRDQRPWQALLEKSWEMDRGCFSLFEDAEKGLVTERAGGVVMFVTEDIEIGIAPRGVRKGDVLCGFGGGDGALPFSAIVREVERGSKGCGFKVLGRARSKVEPLFDDASGARISETSKSARKWTSYSGKARVVEVEFGLASLQAMTCPLRFK